VLPAGNGIHYKFVTIRPDGFVDWEPGPDRWLQIPENGRAAVISGPFGETATSWTPTTAP